jgi:hypothetical protein
MKTALRAALRDDQYERLKRAALARYEQIIQDQEWSERDETLRRFEHRAEGDYRDRTGVLESNRSRPLHKIFQLKNETLGIVRGVKRFLLARICKDLFGGEPFFFVRPEGRIDDDLAEAMQKHAGWKLRGAEYKTKIKRAIETLLDLGSVPVKTTWEVCEDVSESLETILCDRATGKPILTADGEYIYFEDETIPASQGYAGTGPASRGYAGTSPALGQGDEPGTWAMDGAPSAPGANAAQGDPASGPLEPHETAPGAGQGSDQAGEAAAADDDGGTPPDNGQAADSQPSTINHQLLPPRAFTKAPGIIVDPAKYEWREHLVEQKMRLFNGLRVDACERKDVFWPINAPTIEDADMIAHRFDLKLSAIRAKYAPGSIQDSFGERLSSATAKAGDILPDLDGPDIASGLEAPGTDPDAEPGAGAADAPRDPYEEEVAAILDALKDQARAPQSEADKPYRNEAEASAPDDDPMVQVAEVSFDFDCFEDGQPRRLHLVLLPQERECIYAEYRAALAPRAAKNIHLLTINRRRNRAYGRGLYEIYEHMADAADQLLNAILYRNQYVSDPTKIWNPQNTNEGKANPDLKFEPGMTYSTAGSQIDPKAILTTVEIPDLDERTWKLMELFMQMIQLDSGVTNANQGDVSNLPSNSTATGVNSMLESSSVLHQFVLEEIRDCLTPQLAFAIGLIYLRQDEDETYEYLHGDAAGGRAVQQVMELAQARKLQHLPMNVDILLTRTKWDEWRQSSSAALPVAVQYNQLPPHIQQCVRSIVLQMMRSLGFNNPEDIAPRPENPTPGAQSGPPDGTAAGTNTPNSAPPTGLPPMGQAQGPGNLPPQGASAPMNS